MAYNREEWLQGADEFGAPLEDREKVTVVSDTADINATMSIPGIQYQSDPVLYTRSQPVKFVQLPLSLLFKKIEYALADGTAVVEQTGGSVSIRPNVLNRWASPVTSLSISMIAGKASCVSEYMLEFTVSGSGFAITFDSPVRWADGETPVWTDGKTYQVSIVNGLGVCAGWEAATA